MNKWKRRIILAVIALALNLAGRYMTLKFYCPAYMNLTGTILVSYFEGPIVGAVVAAVSGGLSTIFKHTDWCFLLADIGVALATGFLSRKNRYFEKPLLTVSATAFLALVKAPILLITNLFVYDGRTGLTLGDAIIDYIGSVSFPVALRYIVASIFISFTDVFFAQLLIFLGLCIRKYHKKRRTAARLKKELGRVTLGLFLAATVFMAIMPVQSRADDGVNFTERLYNSENGLVGGCVNDIDMTADGGMWVGTYGGLYRFNGSKFILMNNIKSVRSIQTLYVDKYDRLWAGTQDAGVTLLNIDMTYSTLDANNGLPSNAVKEIISDSNDLYYFGTTNGLATAKCKDGEVILTGIHSEVGNIKNFSADEDGHVIALDSFGDILLLEEGKITHRFTLDKYTPTCVKYDPDGFILVGTEEESIRKCKISGNKLEEVAAFSARGLKTINDFYFEGDLTYISSDTGIGYLDASNRLTIIETGEFNNSIDTIFKDYQGNLWFTSSRCGLLSLNKSSFTDVFKLCNIKPATANVIREWNGYLYVGTDDGMKVLNLETGNSVFNRMTSVFDGLRVRSMAMDKGGKLLVATYGKSLMEVSADGTATPYLGEDELEKKIRLVVRLSDGTIITSSDAGLTFLQDHKILYKMPLGEELSGGAILNILETPEGELLAGSDGDGIEIIKDGKVIKRITREDGLISGVILRIVKDTNGEGYFVLTGSGLCYLDSDYSIKELAVPYFNNFDIVQNNKEEVFIIGGAGIYVMNYDTLMAEGGAETYNLLDVKSGLPGSITSNAWNIVTNKGILYFCGTTGIYSLDLNNYEMDVNEYKTKITSIKLDNEYKDVTQIGRIEIPRGTQRIEFTLETNNYTSTDPYIRYFMNGVDAEKITIPSSELETITYYKVPYGEHDFKIEVLDDSGKVMSDQVYIFAKEREVYETLSFQLYFYIILFTFIIFIVISIVQGALMEQNKKESNRHEKVVSQLEKEKTEALERALHMEEDANRTKSEFLANMSHEIRTPINAIIGMDTMIMRETKEPAIKNYARDIHSASKTLLSLINDILDFSKIESGKLELVQGEYDLSVVINDLVNMIRPKADGKKLEFEVNVNPDIPNGLYGDDVRIEQIAINILNNAVKYTDKGKVTFNVDYENADGGSILLKMSVTDTGIGIKPEDQEKLFSPYERLEEQRNKNIEGTGLGMSITENLLEKMGSRLEVSSVYGEGSTFSFAIVQPVRSLDKIGDYKEKAEGKNVVVTENEKYHAPNAKVLVVDDVEMNLIVAQNLLKRVQIKIETAMSGTQAVELAKQKQYDIILMDSMMPGMNGEETMRVIRSDCPLNIETPIIVLTAHAVKGAREEYLRLGYTNYLSKPLDGIKLEAMLQSYLPDEKIILVGEDEAPTQTERIQTGEEKKDSILAKISAIDGIDVQSGIETAGGEDAYGVICRNFHDTAKMRMERIRDAFEKGDYENYTIQVHALKSSARLLGAFDFSERALTLETAGREGNIDLINLKTPAILEEYEAYYEKLDEIFAEGTEAEDERPEIAEKELKANLSDMAELLEAFDFDTAKDLFESLKEYKMPSGYETLYSSIEAQMAEVNRDGVLELIKNNL